MKRVQSKWVENQTRLENAVDQLFRYGEIDERIITLIEKVSDLNDDIVNMRCRESCITPTIQTIKNILDEIGK